MVVVFTGFPSDEEEIAHTGGVASSKNLTGHRFNAKREAQGLLRGLNRPVFAGLAGPG